MGSIFDSFEIGRRALLASQFGLQITGRNIANVNTPGYSRQSPELVPVPPEGYFKLGIGGGVSIAGIHTFRDQFLEARLTTEASKTGLFQAQRDALKGVEEVFNDLSTTGLSDTLNQFFGAFSELASNPTSLPLRTNVVQSGQNLATAFRTTYSQLQNIERGLDAQIPPIVQRVNDLASEIARFNGDISIARGAGRDASALIDQRQQAINQLAELVPVRLTETEGDQLTVSIGSGQALVLSNRAIPLATSFGADGKTHIFIGKTDLTSSIDGGRLGGLLSVRDQHIPSLLSDLDNLASSVITEVNRLHSNGEDLTGAAGGNFFTPTNAGASAAATLSVEASVAADPRKVAAAAAGAGEGDNTNARALADLARTLLTAGSRTGTPSEIYSQLVSSVGSLVATVEAANKTQDAIVAQLNNQRDQVSGVSLDEEAISLLQYQRAFQAAARFINVASQLTQTVLELAQ
jgi:flagellar hook-associated protein 1 FlgK